MRGRALLRVLLMSGRHETTAVLCQCGWGLLSVKVCEVPETCPICGFDFWSYFGAPECLTCDAEHVRELAQVAP